MALLFLKLMEGLFIDWLKYTQTFPGLTSIYICSSIQSTIETGLLAHTVSIVGNPDGETVEGQCKRNTNSD